MSGQAVTAAGVAAAHYHGGPQELPTLEGLRLVSAVAVVWFHCQGVARPITGAGPPGMWLVRTGYFAVDALFVLSGFAQFLPFAAAHPGAKQDWRGYAVRRALRIAPAYYVALFLTALYVGGQGPSPGLWELVGHAAFLQHVLYGVGGREGLGINTAVWTLTTEAAFYVVLPFVAGAFRRRPVAGVGVGLVVSLGWRWLAIGRAGSGAPSVYLISQAPAFAFHLALGMAAAMVVVNLRRMASAGPQAARSIGVVGAVVVAWAVAVLFAWQRASDPAGHGFSQSFGVYDRFVWNLAPAAAFAMLVAALAVAPRRVTWPLGNRVARWAGEATYGTYLFHTLVMLEVAKRWSRLGHRPMPLWEIGLLVTAESILVGRLSFLVVEEPARRLGRSIAAGLAGTVGITPAGPPPLRRVRPLTRWSLRAESTSPAARWGAGSGRR